jgi:uncharacterized protein
MRLVLDLLARATASRPIALLVLLAVTTGILGVFASQQRVDADLTAFAPDTERSRAYERIQDDFGVGAATVQVIVDAGEGRDVLAPAPLADTRTILEALERSAPLQAVLAEPSAAGPSIASFADPVLGALEQQGIDLGTVPEAELDAIVQQTFASPQGSQLALLLSRDRDLEAGSAQGGLIIVRLAPELDENGAADAARAVRQAVEAAELTATRALAFNRAILITDLEGGLVDELPFLLGLSLLLIVGILTLLYRTILDVVLGLAGLIITITWMYGIGVLLGPDYLGIVGYFSQISIVVPVLLVGLGIDYAIHLTSRYREERAGDAAPDRAAAAAIGSVGGALVLATITTMVAFLTNVFTPLPPVRDFGIFTAVGVLSAFIVMVVLVPAARHAVDRRWSTSRRARSAARDAGGTGPAQLRAVMARAALLTEHAPRVTLGVALTVTILAGTAATQVPTEFSQDDFIPEGSYAAEALETTEALFGGDLTEQTYVLVDGDLADPSVANAVLDTHAAIATDVAGDLVRGEGGVADVTSAPGLVADVARLVAAGELPPDADAEGLTAALEDSGWQGDRFAADADVEALYGLVEEVLPGQLDRVLAGDRGLLIIGTTAGEEQADVLEEQLVAATAPIAEAGASRTVVSQQLVFGETLSAMGESQNRSILITLVAALVLLVGYYGVTQRQPLLGVLTMVPSTLSAAWVIGSMWVLGLSFNVLTSTIAALAIGIGVPYGIHITHRFVEDRRRYAGVDEAMRQTMLHTGGALAGSAITTAVGFGVLVLGSLTPIQQFGGVTALTILYALVGGVLVQPSLLVLWDRWTRRLESPGVPTDPTTEVPAEPPAKAPAEPPAKAPAEPPAKAPAEPPA